MDKVSRHFGSFITGCVSLLNITISVADQQHLLQETQLVLTEQRVQINNQGEHTRLPVEDRNKAPTASVYGQMSFMALHVDDGYVTVDQFGTNSIENNRLGISTLLKQQNSLTVGSRLQLGFNPGATEDIEIRQAEVYLDIAALGRLTFGQGETASDGVAHKDLSEMELAGRPNGIGGFANRYHFNSNSNLPKVGDVVNELNGLYRKVRIRYDSGNLDGFTISASATANDQDIALRTNHSLGDIKLSTALAITSKQAVGSVYGGEKASGKVVSGSMSILSKGLVLTAAAGRLLADESLRKSPSYYFLKPTYRFNFFDTGFTGFSASYGRYSSFMQNDDVAVSRGIQVVQQLKSLNLKAYAGYSDVKLKRAGENFDQIDAIFTGIFYKF